MGYRFRPLPGTAFVGLPLVLLAAAWRLAPYLGEDGAVRFVQFASITLGLGGAFTVSRDVDLPEPVLASAPHPYWRTPAVRAAIWVSASGIVIVLTGAILDRRAVAPLPVDLVARLALADLVFVSGMAFLSSIPWGSFVGGAAALCGVGVCAILERLWTSWPLRVLDGVRAPHFDRTRVWLMCAGIACVVAGLHHLRARGLRIIHMYI